MSRKLKELEVNPPATPEKSPPMLTRRQALSTALAASAALGLVAFPTRRAIAQTPEALTAAEEEAAGGQTNEPEASGVTPQVTEALSAYIADSQTAAIPEEIREMARLHILDTLAGIVACRDLTPSRLARDYCLGMSGDCRKNAATILGTRHKAALVDAAFASAMTAHAAEINDFIPSAYVQPGPAIVSTAICLAENRDKSGEEILRAVIVGYELAGRIPKAIGTRNLYTAGIANHGIGPVFGSAAAAASILGLHQDRIPHVLAYCAEQASGSWQWLLDVEHIEKAFVFAGMGARNGLQAALMVEKGFTGVRDSLDNPEGWMAWPAFSGQGANRAYLIEQLGSRSELSLTAFKRYPVGGPTQPAIEGLLELLPDIDRTQVEHVTIAMPGSWEKFRDNKMPALNLRYTTAIVLLDGRLDFTAAQSLERMNNDAQTKAMMEKVEIVYDPSQEAPEGQPRVESAKVTVLETSGVAHEIFIPEVPGYPTDPMSREQVEEKALELLSPCIGKWRARELTVLSRNFESIHRGGKLAWMIAR